MILRTALNSLTDLDEIIEHFSEKLKNSPDKNAINKAKTKLSATIEELKNLPGNPPEGKQLVALKYMDIDFDNDNEDFCYNIDCSCYVDEESYGLEGFDWKDLIDLNIDDKFINEYGLVPILASILYDMTWHGYNYEEVKSNQENFMNGLDESIKEYETMSEEEREVHTISFEEFEKRIEEEFNILPTSDEEKAEIQKKSEICLKFNMQERKKMLGE